VKKLIASTLILLTSSACATIVDGTSQQVNVNTSPSTRAECTLRDTKTTYRVKAPGSVHLHKGDGPLDVHCRSESMSGKLHVQENMDGWFVGNIIAGGIIGGAVDAASGAYQQYPDTITVPMTSGRNSTKALEPHPPQQSRPRGIRSVGQDFIDFLEN
jgi:hypothetical protein